jgi:hypothetical protein
LEVQPYLGTGAVYNLKSSRFLLRRQSPFSQKKIVAVARRGGCDWDGRRDEKEEMSIAEPNLGPARFRDAIKKIAV